jgi:FkbM family methyltransferase
VSTSDKVIGREVYVQRAAFDFPKLQLARTLLGHEEPFAFLIDVGANIGTVSIAAINHGCVKRALAIEPEPLNFSLLLANVSLNQLEDRIICCNFAVGDSSDESLMMELSERNYGNHRISSVRLDGPVRRQISVESKRLDDVIQSLNVRDALIWLDVEGYEGHVLAGACNVIKAGMPIVFEFSPGGLDRFDSYSLLRGLLLSGRYTKLFDLREGPGKQLTLDERTLDLLYEELKGLDRLTDLLLC